MMLSIKNQSDIKMNKAFTPRPSADAQAYIAAAPDGNKAEAPAVADKPKREKGKLITITLPLELLETVDKAAKAKSLSRASYIKLTLAEATKQA